MNGEGFAYFRYADWFFNKRYPKQCRCRGCQRVLLRWAWPRLQGRVR
jgi:hypothetical protein